MSLFWNKGSFAKEAIEPQNLIKKSLTSELAKVIKSLQHEQISSVEPVYSGDSANAVCNVLEAIFIHGLKDSFYSKASSAIIGGERIPEPSFWDCVSAYTHKDILSQIDHLSQISTEIGYCRVWIRMAVNDNLMESYVEAMQNDQKNLRYYYSRWAYLRDVEEPDIMKQLLQGLMNFKFKLAYNSSVLNQWTDTPINLASHQPEVPVARVASPVPSVARVENVSSPQPSCAPAKPQLRDIIPADLSESSIEEVGIAETSGTEIPEAPSTPMPWLESAIEAEHYYGHVDEEDELCMSHTQSALSDTCTADVFAEPVAPPVANAAAARQQDWSDYTAAYVASTMDAYARKHDDGGGALSVEQRPLRKHDVDDDPESHRRRRRRHDDAGTSHAGEEEPSSERREAREERRTGAERKASGNQLTAHDGWSSSFEDAVPLPLPQQQQQTPSIDDGQTYDALLKNYAPAVTSTLTSMEPSLMKDGSNSDVSPSLIKSSSGQQESGDEGDGQLQWQLSDPSDFEVLPLGVNITSENADFRTQNLLAIVGNICNENGLYAQNYQCMGCSRPIGMIYGKARVCTFDGAYYCYECHENDENVIPARIIHNWDFRKHKVAKYTKLLLDRIQEEPLFDLGRLNPSIYGVVSEMHDILALRRRLNFLKTYLFTCKQSVADELRKQVWPREYLYENVHLYSTSELLQVESGLLQQTLRRLVAYCMKHVSTCPLCTQKGFICEICHNPKVIFPFEVSTTYRCDKCQTVFHSDCMNELKPCPKCERRKKRQQNVDTIDYAYVPDSEA